MININKGYLRLVMESDIDFLFQLANDPLCRNNSFHTEPIIYSEHTSWFNQILHSDSKRLYIYMSDSNQCIGQIRLDFDKKEVCISYSIKNEFRGQGYGKSIILRAEDIIRSYHDIKEIHAKVKPNNVASRSIFEHLNYIENVNESYIEYIKLL